MKNGGERIKVVHFNPITGKHGVNLDGKTVEHSGIDRCDMAKNRTKTRIYVKKRTSVKNVDNIVYLCNLLKS